MTKRESEGDDLAARGAIFFLKMTGQSGRDCLIFLDEMRNLVEAAAEPYPRRIERADAVGLRFQLATNEANLLRLPILSGMLLSSLPRAFVKDADAKALLRSTSIALAVERHGLANGGRLPETLNDLVPDFMSAVPQDPFDGQPLRFKRLDKGYCIYSIGRDRVDDGGLQKQSKDGECHDIVFTVKR